MCVSPVVPACAPIVAEGQSWGWLTEIKTSRKTSMGRAEAVLGSRVKSRSGKT